MLGLLYLMLDCWLEVSLHPEGPAIAQLDQGFPWLSLAAEQMLSWYPNSTLHCMLHMHPNGNIKISHQCIPPNVGLNQGESVFRLRNLNIVGFPTFILLCYMFRSYDHLQAHIFSIGFTLLTTDLLYLE
jgi:hypothetical protein